MSSARPKIAKRKASERATILSSPAAPHEAVGFFRLASAVVPKTCAMLAHAASARLLNASLRFAIRESSQASISLLSHATLREPT